MQTVFEKIIDNLYAYSDADEAEQYGTIPVIELDRAIESVKQEAEQYNNGWIACTDRLPTREEYQRGNGRFLVTDGNRTYEAEFDIYESHTFGKSRMAIDWFITDKCVTHWQNEPLPPQPYQPNGEING